MLFLFDNNRLSLWLNTSRMAQYAKCRDQTNRRRYWVRFCVLSRRRTRTAGLKRRSNGCWRPSWKRTWTCWAAAAARGDTRGRRPPKRTRCASWIWCCRRSGGDRSTCGASSRRAKSTFDSGNARRRRGTDGSCRWNDVVSAGSDSVNVITHTHTHFGSMSKLSINVV